MRLLRWTVKQFRLLLICLRSIKSILILLIYLKAGELRDRVRNRKLKRKRESRMNETDQERPRIETAGAGDQLPPFPESPDELTGKNGDGLGTEKSSTDDTVSIELCTDVVKLPFELWHIAVPPVEPLPDPYARQLAKPFSRIIEKHGLGKYLKDEVILLIGLSTAVIPRVQQTRAYYATKDIKPIEKTE